MSDLELIDAVAHVTSEDSQKIRRRGFVLTGPDDSGLEPECLLNVMLVDFPESGTVDCDALGFRCREPFFTSTLARRRWSSVPCRAAPVRPPVRMATARPRHDPGREFRDTGLA